MNNYLLETDLLNFRHPAITALIDQRGWRDLSDYEKIGAAYRFVQNEIVFGYNRADDIPASEVLRDGYGQCNTKGTLLMALLRTLNVPCRFHGFTIDKRLQRGAITGIAYRLAPTSIIHSWVEVLYEGCWVNLEGFILDKVYLRSLQTKFPNVGAFCGYGAATPDLNNPPIDWHGEDTYIQAEGIDHDYGVFDDPDTFYREHGGNLGGFKAFLYQNFVRHWMNANVENIRRLEEQLKRSTKETTT